MSNEMWSDGSRKCVSFAHVNQFLMKIKPLVLKAAVMSVIWEQ